MTDVAPDPAPEPPVEDGNAKPYSVSELAFALKRALPSMPAVVGVITSPTGAVIRDILHRIRDRWPCRVVVWPVVVQGDAAAAQVSAAIRGFCALDPAGAIPRPDVLIVARGG